MAALDFGKLLKHMEENKQAAMEQEKTKKAWLSDPFFRGTQWTADEIEHMKAQAAHKHDDKVDPFAFTFNSTVWPPRKEPDPPPVFTDSSDGYTFGPNIWRGAVAVQGKAHLRADALAHRDEALRRKTVCLLEGLRKEAAHWHAQMRYLEKLFALPEIEHDA